MNVINPSLLIIDDDQDTLILISRILEKSFPDVSVYSAASGVAGLKLAKKYRPDTILLDVCMPNMDGFSVCKQLKEEESTKNIPLLRKQGNS